MPGLRAAAASSPFYLRPASPDALDAVGANLRVGMLPLPNRHPKFPTAWRSRVGEIEKLLTGKGIEHGTPARRTSSFCGFSISASILVLHANELLSIDATNDRVV